MKIDANYKRGQVECLSPLKSMMQLYFTPVSVAIGCLVDFALETLVSKTLCQESYRFLRSRGRCDLVIPLESGYSHHVWQVMLLRQIWGVHHPKLGDVFCPMESIP